MLHGVKCKVLNLGVLLAEVEHKYADEIEVGLSIFTSVKAECKHVEEIYQDIQRGQNKKWIHKKLDDFSRFPQSKLS